jgi:hypothetical protein
MSLLLRMPQVFCTLQALLVATLQPLHGAGTTRAQRLLGAGAACGKHAQAHHDTARGTALMLIARLAV